MGTTTDNTRCKSGRGSGRKVSLEVFGGPPRLLQAGIFAPAPVKSHEEYVASTRSTLFESMMIDSATVKMAPNSLGRSLERSLSERVSGTRSNSSQGVHRESEQPKGTPENHKVSALAEKPRRTIPRRYSLFDGKTNSVCSGYPQYPSGMISTEVLRALATFQQTFVVTDATQPDCPIMFASACFLAMTGYSHGEVIGRNCRFLQGPGTDCKEVARIREALRCESNFSGKLLNYKKNGRPFWNLLTITPIRDAHNRVIMCIGMQAEVSKYTEGCRENALRPKGLSAALVRYESRQLDRAADVVTEIVGAFRKSTLSVEPQAGVDLNKVHRPIPLSASRDSPYQNLGPNLLQRGHSGSNSRRDSTRDPRVPVPCPSPGGTAQPLKKRRISKFMSLLGFSTSWRLSRRREGREDATELRMTNCSGDEDGNDDDGEDRALVIRRAFDLATSLERIEKSFVITDPRLPDNPIIFASDQFLELTEYSREDVLGCNCRFLQGPETDPAAVRQIKDAIDESRDISVQLVNYTKSGKPFRNLFHLQAVHDPKGELQYFIGVHQSPQGILPDYAERERAKMGEEAATTIDNATHELPNVQQSPRSLWAIHSKSIISKSQMQQGSRAWKKLLKAQSKNAKLGSKSFSTLWGHWKVKIISINS